MKIVEPSVELLVQSDPIDHVARCARICYQSEPKDEDANRRLYDGLLKRHHYSMFRHETHYFIIPRKDDEEYYIRGFNVACKSEFIEVYDKHNDEDIYIAANGHWVKEHINVIYFLIKYEVDAEYFNETKIGHSMMRYTFVLTTQISTSRELNRVSPNNIAEMSTRYIKFGGKVEPSIVRPWWMIGKDIDYGRYHTIDRTKGKNIVSAYIAAANRAFNHYEELLNLGIKPEDARGVLPLDTLTKVIYTYSVSQWKHIIDLRYYGTTGKPHGNAELIIGRVKEELEKLGYEFEDSKSNN